LLRRLWGLASAKGPDAERAAALLKAQLVEGRSVGMAHLALGTIAWDNGRKDEGQLHLEQAYRAGPHVPVVGNNLAWMLAHSDPPQYDRALEVIGRVLEAHPNEPRFRGTRGHVLAKIGRWKDAVPDLEAALAADPKNAALHAVLADAYSTLGDPVLSSLHKNWKSLPAEPAAGAKTSPGSTP
jgi:predicted Zn-dependent protease